MIGDTEIAIDYTAYPYILELSELLIKYGFNVKRIYSDNFPADERDAFERIIADEKCADIMIYPTNDPAMRFAAGCGCDLNSDAGLCKTGIDAGSAADGADKMILAIGQKAAYFTGTEHFVDIVEGGGCYGYQAVEKLSELLIDAYRNPKETKKIISHKGWGCESCL